MKKIVKILKENSESEENEKSFLVALWEIKKEEKKKSRSELLYTDLLLVMRVT